MGNLAEGVSGTLQRLWLSSRNVHSQEPCRSCWARYMCGGAATMRQFTVAALRATIFAAG
jgi:radical SAM protein with 4Fe4S-binding SPASM domain